jgi:hypothetical protein
VRADRPEHRGHVVDRVCINRDAAHNDDPSAFLDLFENSPKVAIKRWVAAILGSDLWQRETGAANLEQNVLQCCDVPCTKIEGNAVFGKVAAAPSHRVINARAVDWGHDTCS